ncbi:hypothetical protein [Amycolatopsis pigmentata]|uniref:DUF3040 domain-containing protein n=1 Tax=Amycolatopsis pigmentata TaxID=450801 RepID=A0ABW5FM60_9PSEU
MMALTLKERRALAGMDRVLSDDPVLAAIAGLFAAAVPARQELRMSPPVPRPGPVDKVRVPTRHQPAPRRRVVMILSILTVLGGITDIVTAAVRVPLAIGTIGVLVTAFGIILLVAELAGVGTRVGRSATSQPKP